MTASPKQPSCFPVTFPPVGAGKKIRTMQNNIPAGSEPPTGMILRAYFS